MNALTPIAPGAVSTVFAGQMPSNELGAGISGGYGILKYKGKVWTISQGGNELQLMRDDGDGPRNSVEVVILKAATQIGKIWYEKGFTEGSTEKPDCFSSNGLTPDPSALKKQSPVCATCPKNAWGSAVKQDGTSGKGKACSDSKRLAIVPAQDIKNEVFGGAMLLRNPAASLQALAAYGAALQKLGYPYFAVVTRIAFDPQAAHPQFVFTPVRALTDDEAKLVIEHRNDAKLDQIVAEQHEAAVPAQQPAGIQFEQPPAGPAPAALVAPAATPAPTPAPAPAPTPAPAPAAVNGFGAAAPTATPAPAPTPAPAKPKATKPKPAPAPTPAPAQVTPEVTAGGFGATAPLTGEAPSTAPAADAASFDDALDAELDKLMA
jgi:hypothetical protein